MAPPRRWAPLRVTLRTSDEGLDWRLQRTECWGGRQACWPAPQCESVYRGPRVVRDGLRAAAAAQQAGPSRPRWQPWRVPNHSDLPPALRGAKQGGLGAVSLQNLLLRWRQQLTKAEPSCTPLIPSSSYGHIHFISRWNTTLAARNTPVHAWSCSVRLANRGQRPAP